MPIQYLLKTVHLYEEGDDSLEAGIHVAPLLFIQGALLKAPPPIEPLQDPLSVMIAHKHYRDRARDSHECSYLINQNSTVILFGRRVEGMMFPYGTYFTVKVSEDSEGHFFALKRATLLNQHIIGLAEDAQKKPAHKENGQLSLLALLNYLELKKDSAFHIHAAIDPIFDDRWTMAQKKEAILHFLRQIPLEVFHHFFNAVDMKPIPAQHKILVSYLVDLKKEYLVLKRLNRLKSATLYLGKKGLPKFVLETPLIDGFDLYETLQHNYFNIETLSWSKKGQFIFKITMAYQQWLVNGILNHGDLNPRNIMVFRNAYGELDCQLIDGNFTYFEEDLETGNIPLLLDHGTPKYMAPELLNPRPGTYSAEELREYLVKADIFALGILIIRFMTFQHHYEEMLEYPTDRLLGRSIFQGHMREMVDAKLPAALKTSSEDQAQQEAVYFFASKMIALNPAHRPNFKQVFDFIETISSKIIMSERCTYL